MKIGIPKEIHAGEKRIAATPETSRWIKKLGFSVVIEAGAGVAACYLDDAYRVEGVEVLEDTRELWAGSDIILKVRAPEFHPALGVHETELLREGGHLFSFIWPGQNKELMEKEQTVSRSLHILQAIFCMQLHRQFYSFLRLKKTVLQRWRLHNHAKVSGAGVLEEKLYLGLLFVLARHGGHRS